MQYNHTYTAKQYYLGELWGLRGFEDRIQGFKIKFNGARKRLIAQISYVEIMFKCFDV